MRFCCSLAVSLAAREGEPTEERERKVLLLNTVLWMLPATGFFAYRAVQTTWERIVKYGDPPDMTEVGNMLAAVVMILFTALVLITKRLPLRWGEILTAIFTVAVILLDWGKGSNDRGEAWPIGVVLMDLLLCIGAGPCATRGCLVLLAAWVMIRSAEDQYRFGIYEFPRTITHSGNRPECLRKPSILAGLGDTFVRLIPFLVDFWVTRKFATDIRTCIALAQMTAQALARYDLDQAEAALRSDRAQHLPRPLRDAFAELIDNLARYKPYLPQSCFCHSVAFENPVEELNIDQFDMHSGTTGDWKTGTATQSAAPTANCTPNTTPGELPVTTWPSTGQSGDAHGAKGPVMFTPASTVSVVVPSALRSTISAAARGVSAVRAMSTATTETAASAGDRFGERRTTQSSVSPSVAAATAAGGRERTGATATERSVLSAAPVMSLGLLPGQPLPQQHTPSHTPAQQHTPVPRTPLVAPGQPRTPLLGPGNAPPPSRRVATLLALNRSGFLPAVARAAPAAVSAWAEQAVTGACAAIVAQRGIVDLIAADHAFGSFGAVRPCASQRQCAPRAAAAAGPNAALLGFTELPPTAATCCAAALCGDFGSAAQRRFMVVGGLSSWVAVLDRVAARWGARVLCDEVVHADCEMQWHCRLRSYASFAKHSASPLVLWELTAERESAGSLQWSEEWMYMLDALQPNRWEGCNNALELWASLDAKTRDPAAALQAARDAAASTEAEDVRVAALELERRMAGAAPAPLPLDEAPIAAAPAPPTAPADQLAELQRMQEEELQVTQRVRGEEQRRQQLRVERAVALKRRQKDTRPSSLLLSVDGQLRRGIDCSVSSMGQPLDAYEANMVDSSGEFAAVQQVPVPQAKVEHKAASSRQQHLTRISSQNKGGPVSPAFSTKANENASNPASPVSAFSNGPMVSPPISPLLSPPAHGGSSLVQISPESKARRELAIRRGRSVTSEPKTPKTPIENEQLQMGQESMRRQNITSTFHAELC